MRTPEEIAQDCGYDPDPPEDENGIAEDMPLDNLIAYKDALEDAYRSARSALLTIAGGVPRLDEWTSAAAFMESTADVLDTFKVERPDHYEEGEF